VERELGCEGCATVTSSRHRAAQTGQTLPEKQRRWKVWLHSDVTVAWPRSMALWQTEHESAVGGTGEGQKVFGAADGRGPNRLVPKDGVDDWTVKLKGGDLEVVCGDDDPIAEEVDDPNREGLDVAEDDDPNTEELDIVEEDDPNTGDDPNRE
jgi:hypothetical protein